MIYSFLISTALNVFLKLLALPDNAIVNLKKNKIKANINKRKVDLEKNLKFKFLLYFLLSSLLLLFFWYYITIFDIVYKNTQIILIIDTITSFVLSFVYPFFINLLPCIFRIPALAYKRKNGKYIYNFSKILQLL